jgi:hypothetical protein
MRFSLLQLLALVTAICLLCGLVAFLPLLVAWALAMMFIAAGFVSAVFVAAGFSMVCWRASVHAWNRFSPTAGRHWRKA